MHDETFDRFLRDITAAEKAKKGGVRWTFGAKPSGWVGLLNLANGLIESTTDGHGNVIVDARYSEMLQRDMQRLGQKLRAIALGANAGKVFGQLSSKKKPDQAMQHINYAVTFWRARAKGLNPDTAAYAAQCHFPEFEPPNKASIKRYASTHRNRAFDILVGEGLDVTDLRRIGSARGSSASRTPERRRLIDSPKKAKSGR